MIRQAISKLLGTDAATHGVVQPHAGETVIPKPTHPLGIPLPEAFHVLESQCRADAIAVMSELDIGEQLGLNELAREIAARKHDGSENVGSKEKKRVYISLYHRHIHVLDRTKAVHYDADSQTVSPGVELDAIVQLLKVAVHQRDVYEEGRN